MNIEFELTNEAVLDWVENAEPLSSDNEYTYQGNLRMVVNGTSVSDDMWVTVDLIEDSVKLHGRLSIIEKRKSDDASTIITDHQFNTRYTLSEREQDLFKTALETRLMTERKLSQQTKKQQNNERNNHQTAEPR